MGINVAFLKKTDLICKYPKKEVGILHLIHLRHVRHFQWDLGKYSGEFIQIKFLLI